MYAPSAARQSAGRSASMVRMLYRAASASVFRAGTASRALWRVAQRIARAMANVVSPHWYARATRAGAAPRATCQFVLAGAQPLGFALTGRANAPGADLARIVASRSARVVVTSMASATIARASASASTCGRARTARSASASAVARAMANATTGLASATLDGWAASARAGRAPSVARGAAAARKMVVALAMPATAVSIARAPHVPRRARTAALASTARACASRDLAATRVSFPIALRCAAAEVSAATAHATASQVGAATVARCASARRVAPSTAVARAAWAPPCSASAIRAGPASIAARSLAPSIAPASGSASLASVFVRGGTWAWPALSASAPKIAVFMALAMMVSAIVSLVGAASIACLARAPRAVAATAIATRSCSNASAIRGGRAHSAASHVARARHSSARPGVSASTAVVFALAVPRARIAQPRSAQTSAPTTASAVQGCVRVFRGLRAPIARRLAMGATRNARAVARIFAFLIVAASSSASPTWSVGSAISLARAIVSVDA